jgi:anaerobic magnesium-protoporphyrin IX monomethyl ester cyclase
MEINQSFRAFLIFPPVWTPVTPYLALPLLVGYLRKEGIYATQYDASLEYFTKYLLKPDTLSELFNVVSSRRSEGDYAFPSKEAKALINDLKRNQGIWKDKISQVHNLLETMRQDELFYQPEACVRAQSDLYDLLGLASLAYYPISFTFNTFSNNSITDFSRLLELCDDPISNPFLRFYSEALPRKIDAERPALVGISVSTSHQLVGALTMARFIRKAYPSIHITLGGKHIFRLQESFTHDPAFFPEFCNSMIIDNGERPLKKLIEQLGKEAPLTEVPNLVHFDNNRLTFNELGAHEPISELPVPDFSDLALGEYLSPTPIVPMRLSEGCYWGKCTFCSRYDNKKFQTVPPQVAVNQMEELQRRYKVSCFTINDDCLTPTYLEAFSRSIIQKNLRFEISLWCKPVGSFTKKRLGLLSKAGVKLIRWGIETGHPRILKLMKKGTNLEDTLRVLKDSTESGIWNHATMILGFPTETLDEAKQTIRFLEENQDIIHSSIFFQFVLLNQSYIMNNPDEFNIESVSIERNPFVYERGFTCSKGMDSKTLSSFLTWAQRYRKGEIYGNPLWLYLRIREYLLLYVSRKGLDDVRGCKVNPSDLSVHQLGSRLQYFFKKPNEIPDKIFEKVCQLIESGGEVGTSWIRDNLRNAYLIGYATEQGRVVATMTHKKPLEKYLCYIEKKTHLNLRGYLERGYSMVRPEYRNLLVGDRLLKGLVSHSPGKRIYVTIRMDNTAAIKLTLRNNMRLGGTYFNERTGHEIGVFTNQ